MSTYYERNKERLKAQAAAYKLENREKVLAGYKAYRDKTPNRNKGDKLRNLCTSAVRRSKELGLPTSTADELLDVLRKLGGLEAGCPCCGVEFSSEVKQRATVDRVEPNRGYVVDNVSLLCQDCNRQKQDLTLDKLMVIADYIRKMNVRNI